MPLFLLLLYIYFYYFVVGFFVLVFTFIDFKSSFSLLLLLLSRVAPAPEANSKQPLNRPLKSVTKHCCCTALFKIFFKKCRLYSRAQHVLRAAFYLPSFFYPSMPHFVHCAREKKKQKPLCIMPKGIYISLSAYQARG